ncbi:hypothetical protein [Polaromonas sp.]|uniref:hypothetical protein n=1 Tax=Polaromonas sp. TaxID=1869339 RepID=UPI00272F4A16|nr:hypothetical protein [Polaromonas sp.]MDP1885957.1 hypothetical protein [Polaromonas sp.]
MTRTIYSLALAAAQKEKPWRGRSPSTAGGCRSWQQRALVAALAGALATLPLARAALPPDLNVFDHATVIADDELGHMRGKFVAAGQVMYFGVEMVTQWLASSGQAITASGVLQINLSGNTPQVSFVPTITVEQKAAMGGAASQGSAVAGGGGGLQDVTGVVQNIQVAGTSNGITNTIGINVQNASGQPAPQPQSTGLLSASTTTASGSVASVGLGSNGMNVAVAVPDQGRAMQQIRQVGMGGGQVLQSVQLGGDVNQIHNRINLNVQMNSASGPASPAGNQLLGMKLMPQSGAF